MQTNTALTTRHAFGSSSIDGPKLFDVRDGVPVADALNVASSYLFTAMLAYTSDTENGGGAAHDLTEMAKALIDSVVGSLEFSANAHPEAPAAD